MKALIISADNFEDRELLFPYYRLLEEGVEIEVAAPQRGKIKGKHAYEIEAKSLDEVSANYDVLFLPGGKAPEVVRQQPKAVEISKAFLAANRPVLAICHGPMTLLATGLMKGRRATCWTAVVEEMKAAGAAYEDSEVVVDDNLVTSRQPSDLPAFMRESMKVVQRYRQSR